jgi:hypothetical protein
MVYSCLPSCRFDDHYRIHHAALAHRFHQTGRCEKAKTHSPINEISVSTRISHVKIYKTPAGPLFLRNCCTSSFVESLKADDGLRAFARLPERAHHLLSFALEFGPLEEYLILGLGLSWHWDYEGLGITRFRYREMIARLFAAHGFAGYLTSEPNIRMDPANILVARLGSRLAEESLNRFFQRLLQSETLPGL